jgi:hypothetical protein
MRPNEPEDEAFGKCTGEKGRVAPHGVIDHYGTTSLLRRIDQALRRAGPVDGIIGWADRTSLDQFHVRGLDATRELAEALGIDAGANLLDLGCGLGGSAGSWPRLTSAR